MIADSTTPLKGYSVPFGGNGLYEAIVRHCDGVVATVVVPRLSGDDLEYDDVPVLANDDDPILVAGERVIVSFFEGRQDELIVLGRVRTSSRYPRTTSSSDVSHDGLRVSAGPISDALNKVAGLTGVTFRWTGSALPDRPTADLPDEYGLVASSVGLAPLVHDVAVSNAPGAAQTTVKAVAYERLGPLLVEAVKILKTRVETLEATVANHEARLTGHLI